MPQAILPAGYDDPRSNEPSVVELKDPWLAALLAWLLPGLGHLYQGRSAKGMLFMICILGTFVFGMWIGEGKVVYASPAGQDPWRWQYYCQLGVGASALPALVQKQRVQGRQAPLWGGFMAPPAMKVTPMKDQSGAIARQPNELGKWIAEQHPRYEIGTIYTVVAGLLNVLVVCDAFAGPLVLHARPRPPAAT